ncbi:MAG: ABC transporter permease [Labedaea sp.]
MITAGFLLDAHLRAHRRLGPSARRCGLVAWRNVTALRSAYWLVVVSGFVEPLLYLLSIGVGVGALIGQISLPDGRIVDYAMFVAPAMLGASAMNGATVESTFHFFSKLKYMRLYDAMLVTPLRPAELVLGELAWSVGRGAIYSAEFLAVMVAMKLTTLTRALAALPAAMLVSAAFGALGIVTTTYARSWRDFDLVGAAQFALFVLSGTFFPTSVYPAVVRLMVELTPLIHAVRLLQDIAIGRMHATTFVHAGYLAVVTVAGTIAAGRRVGRLLLT